MNITTIGKQSEETCRTPPENHYVPPEKRCIPQETEITDVRLANAYVPFQKLCETFPPLEGLIKGTIFPPLHNVYGWERLGKGDDMCE